MSDKYTKVGNYYVRRPQATPRKRGLSGQELREIGYAVLVWFLVLIALFYALPILFAAAAG